MCIRDRACDEAAIQALGEGERIPYGKTLLSLIPVRTGPGSPLLLSLIHI